MLRIAGVGGQNAPDDGHHLHLLSDGARRQELALCQVGDAVIGKDFGGQSNAASPEREAFQNGLNGSRVSAPIENGFATDGDVHRAHLGSCPFWGSTRFREALGKQRVLGTATIVNR
jgi:hypothetical protein